MPLDNILFQKNAHVFIAVLGCSDIVYFCEEMYLLFRQINDANMDWHTLKVIGLHNWVLITADA